MASEFLVLTITSIKEEIQGFKTFEFQQESNKQFSYKAGQYLTLLLPLLGEKIRRSYSITSSPALLEPLSVGIKRIENGIFSRYLTDKAKVGDKLLTTGTSGFFTLPESDEVSFKQVFLLAAGSGITPIYSILKTLLYTYPHVRVILIYSNSSIEKTIFLKELKYFADQFQDKLKIEFLFSNAADLSRARLYKDLLQEFLKEHAIAPFNEILFYICGPLNYMRMCYYALRQVNVPTENIRRESFATEKATPKVAPPDKLPHFITANFKHHSYKFKSEYPATILQAARAKGIALPYSCEAGRCGSCVARCTKGKVWMSYNEVLTERELAKGLVLTCVGYPVFGDAMLDIL